MGTGKALMARTISNHMVDCDIETVPVEGDHFLLWRCRFCLLIPFVIGLCTVSCVEPRRTNPLDSNVELLFVPRILEPTGGEEWFPGTQQTIQWLPATQVIDSLVTLQLICNTDTITLAEDFPNAGRFSWIVSGTPSTDCKIRIVGKVGAAESPANFRIKPLPVVEKLDIGLHKGRTPSALREKVLFVSNLSGNDDIWLLDRDDGTIVRQTNNSAGDLEPTWFKPLGKIFAYTALDSSGTRNIWVSATEGPGAGGKKQITFTGGEAPAWQNTDELNQLALAYINTDTNHPQRRQILAGRLNTPINTLPLLGNPAFETLPFAVSEQSFNVETQIRTLTWHYINHENLFIYQAGTGINNIRLQQVDFPVQNFASAISRDFPISISLKPSQPRISPSGKWVAFSMNGDIWVSSISGTIVSQLTIDENIDEYPDWATESEIVFSRRALSFSSRELWTLQVADPP